jgi:glycosyltransferase involved in cell wall biosynthesis
MPSRFDPSPIAYLEAASAGLPVVATTEGGAGELLGSAAVSVHPDDDDAIVAAMLDLADPAVARTRGEEAHRRSEDATWQAVASRVLAAALPDRYPSDRRIT